MSETVSLNGTFLSWMEGQVTEIRKVLSHRWSLGLAPPNSHVARFFFLGLSCGRCWEEKKTLIN